MRAALFISATYLGDSLRVKDHYNQGTGWFYFCVFIILLVMDISEMVG